jgi:Flp pilus assembly protein protease CpaA
MIKGCSKTIMRSKWSMPLICLWLGLMVFLASWLGGQLGAGLVSLAIMAAFGLFLLLISSRSETVRGLTVRGDERFAQIDLKATAISGLVLIIALIVAWLVQLAEGHDGNPYTWLLAVGGITYLGAVALFRWRG